MKIKLNNGRYAYSIERKDLPKPYCSFITGINIVQVMHTVFNSAIILNSELSKVSVVEIVNHT